jgi:hypothetical protein
VPRAPPGLTGPTSVENSTGRGTRNPNQHDVQTWEQSRRDQPRPAPRSENGMHQGGGDATFGYSATDIGTRSIRFVAAMGLFLMGHPVAKTMILGGGRRTHSSNTFALRSSKGQIR